MTGMITERDREAVDERCSVKKVFLKMLHFSQEKPVFEFRFNNFIKKRLQHRLFPVNIAKFFRTPILKNICERLLLNRWLISLTRQNKKPFVLDFPQFLLSKHFNKNSTLPQSLPAFCSNSYRVPGNIVIKWNNYKSAYSARIMENP